TPPAPPPLSRARPPPGSENAGGPAPVPVESRACASTTGSRRTPSDSATRPRADPADAAPTARAAPGRAAPGGAAPYSAASYGAAFYSAVPGRAADRAAPCRGLPRRGTGRRPGRPARRAAVPEARRPDPPGAARQQVAQAPAQHRARAGEGDAPHLRRRLLQPHPRRRGGREDLRVRDDRRDPRRGAPAAEPLPRPRRADGDAPDLHGPRLLPPQARARGHRRPPRAVGRLLPAARGRQQRSGRPRLRGARRGGARLRRGLLPVRDGRDPGGPGRRAGPGPARPRVLR